MNFDEMEKLLSELDGEYRYCRICHIPFKPYRSNQTICTSSECRRIRQKEYYLKYRNSDDESKYIRQERKKISNRKYMRKKRTLESTTKKEQLYAKWRKQEQFNRLVAEYGDKWGEYQKTKLLKEIKPIETEIKNEKES